MVPEPLLGLDGPSVSPPNNMNDPAARELVLVPPTGVYVMAEVVRKRPGTMRGSHGALLVRELNDTVALLVGRSTRSRGRREKATSDEETRAAFIVASAKDEKQEICSRSSCSLSAARWRTKSRAGRQQE